MAAKSGKQQNTRWQAGFAETLVRPNSKGSAGVSAMQADTHESETAVIRDMDLVRQILFRVEQDPTLDGTNWEPFDLGDTDHSFEDISYHVRLLMEAGLIQGQTVGADMPIVSRLTWDGHEFLDNVRSPEVWATIKDKIKPLGSVALMTLAALAQAEIKKRLGLP